MANKLETLAHKYKIGQKYFTVVTKPERFINKQIGDFHSFHKTKEGAMKEVSNMRDSVKAYVIIDESGNAKSLNHKLV